MPESLPQKPPKSRKTLGEDDYPHLAGEPFTRGSTESLAYLFSPSISTDGKKSYPNATYLFHQDSDGYYYYDSSTTWAKLNTANGLNRFEEQAHTDDPNYSENSYYGFFPLDEKMASGGKSTKTNSHNHYFGVTLSAPFSQFNGGKAKDGKDMTFHFSGDDDVWLFFDGVLVGDAGGIHGVSSIDVNLQSGDVVINASDETAQSTTLRQLFRDAGKENSVQWSGNTFADNTQHRMNLYYLERGNNESNMSIRYNLVSGQTVKANKQLSVGGNNTEDPFPGEFGFELRGYGENVNMPAGATIADGTENGIAYKSCAVTCGEAGDIDFGTVLTDARDLGKEYKYSLREQIPSGATDNRDGTFTKSGITYDAKVYYLKLWVAQENNQIVMKHQWYTDLSFRTPATVEGDAPVFGNTLDSSKDVRIPADKVLLDGGQVASLDANAYSFSMYDSNDTAFNHPLQTKYNTADGTMYFSVPGFKLSDFKETDGSLTPNTQITRTYIIKENVPAGAADKGNGTAVQGDMVYDTEPKTVSVTGTYQGGTDADPITVQLSCSWTKLNGMFDSNGATSGTMFARSFDGTATAATLEALTQGAPMPDKTSAEFTKDADSSGGAIARFGTVDFSGYTGVYRYRVTAGNRSSIFNVTADGQNGAWGWFEPTFTNSHPSFGIKLTKYSRSADAADASQTPLAGAKFTVKQGDEYVQADGSLADTVYEFTTSDAEATKGQVNIAGLRAGTYVITETQAPVGYQKPTGSMTLVVNADGTGKFTSCTGNVTDPFAPDGNGIFSISMTDLKQPDLPDTGGAGTPALQLLGVIALAAGVVLIGRRFYGERSK